MSFKPEAGEWFPIAKKLKVVCCDCSLCHRYEFKLKKDGWWMRGFRDNRSTARRRNRKHVKLELRWVPKNKTGAKRRPARS